MTIPVPPPASDLEWQRRRALATERIARILAWAFGIVIVVAICWGMADIVLLVFAAALLACLLRGGAEVLSQKIGGPVGLWLAAIMLVIVAFLGFGIFVRGPIIAGQLQDIWGQLKEPGHVGCGSATAAPIGFSRCSAAPRIIFRTAPRRSPAWRPG